MTFKTQYGTYENCYLIKDNYPKDGSLYLQLWNDEDGPIATHTKCLPDSILMENKSYVDTNNIPTVLDFIEEYKLGEVIGFKGSGYCTYPLVKFNMDEVNKYVR